MVTFAATIISCSCALGAYKGIGYMLLASLCFAIVNIGIKLLAQPNALLPDLQVYPVHELVFFRSLTSLIICVSVVWRKRIPFWGHNRKWLWVRGASGAAALTLFFFTLKHLPLAISTTVQYLSPVFTVVLAIPLNGEKVRPVRWLFFFISLFGVAWIAYFKEADLHFEPLWLAVGVCSAFLSGIAYNAIVKCRETDAPITVVMYFPLVATPLMFLAGLSFGYVVPQGVEWVLLAAVGILTQVAQIAMTRALHADTPARVTPVKYVGAIYAVAVGFFLFDEQLDLFSTVGILLILLGVLLNTLLKRLNSPSRKV